MKFLLSEEEFRLLSAAAERERLAIGAYAAQACQHAALGITRPEYTVLRELLIELMRLSGQVRRVGVNLNQAVAALHSTGEISDTLMQYAAYTARMIQRVDEVTEAVHRRLP